MSLAIRRAWQPAAAAADCPGHMGVFELADDAGTVLFVGFAGGRSRFGLRGEINDALVRAAAAGDQARPHQAGPPSQFRYEVTTAYLTRYQELLMAHGAAGTWPVHNDPMPRLGRLSPG